MEIDVLHYSWFMLPTQTEVCHRTVDANVKARAPPPIPLILIRMGGAGRGEVVRGRVELCEERLCGVEWRVGVKGGLMWSEVVWRWVCSFSVCNVLVGVGYYRM